MLTAFYKAFCDRNPMSNGKGYFKHIFQIVKFVHFNQTYN